MLVEICRVRVVVFVLVFLDKSGVVCVIIKIDCRLLVLVLNDDLVCLFEIWYVCRDIKWLVLLFFCCFIVVVYRGVVLVVYDLVKVVRVIFMYICILF